MYENLIKFDFLEWGIEKVNDLDYPCINPPDKSNQPTPYTLP